MKRTILLAVLLAVPALGQDRRRYCPNRPDLGASTCTTRPGEVLVELSGVDWERDTVGGAREDMLR
jgi:hypothetical protein